MAQEPPAEPGRRVELRVYRPHQGLRLWEVVSKVQPWLQASFDVLGDETPDSAQARIENGTYQLWLAFVDGRVAAAALSEIVAYPAGPVLELRHIGGERVDEWLEDALGIVAAFGRHMGCRAIEVVARDGWGPRFKKLGAEKVATMYRWGLKLDG